MQPNSQGPQGVPPTNGAPQGPPQGPPPQFQGPVPPQGQPPMGPGGSAPNGAPFSPIGPGGAPMPQGPPQGPPPQFQGPVPPQGQPPMGPGGSAPNGAPFSPIGPGGAPMPQGPPPQQGGQQRQQLPGQAFGPNMRPGGAPAQMPAPAQQKQGKKAPETQAPRPKNTTQNSLMISEVRDNMVVMADGSFRAVIACKSINFDLMSSKEREGVEYSYQNFLNSLTHPVQILIRSQRVDIGPYLDRLIKIRKMQDNMLLGVLMDDYIEFVDILSEEANIMDKSFYVVIPYSVTGDLGSIKDSSKNIFASFFGGGTVLKNVVKIDKITYEKVKEEMKNRIDSVVSGLLQMGVHCQQLKSNQLSELYYSYYNPEIAIREPLSNFSDQTAVYIRKGDGEATRPNMNSGL